MCSKNTRFQSQISSHHAPKSDGVKLEVPKEVCNIDRDVGHWYPEYPTYEYEERIVAYIDIIGWKDEINKITAISPSIKNVIDLLCAEHYSRSRKFQEEVNKKASEEPKLIVNAAYLEQECAIFSDNIVISVPKSFERRIFGTVGLICQKLLKEGFLSRGGIATGYLYHKENVVFGPALIEAVELEKEAILPRVLCSDEIISLMKDWPGNPRNTLIDFLGRTVINPFAPILLNPDFVDPEIEIIGSIIEENINKFSHKGYKNGAKRLEKWKYIEWLLKQGKT